MPRQQQQQQQQHWSRGGGMPRQQQQQHWSRGGGMPRQQQQQQWSRGGGIPHRLQRSSHSFPPARQVRQQQPSRGIPTIGVGGVYDCGSNAVYFLEDSPPPPGAPMCAVYRCGRCGKHGHKSKHCAAPRRFEGTCGACGQYGHIWRNCVRSSRGQLHLNVFTSSGECPVTQAHGTDNIVIPRQQQHHQPAVDLGGQNIPFQQSSDSMHYSNSVSGGGGGDGDAIGTSVQQQMAVAGQRYFVTAAHNSGGEGSDDDGWNSGVARQQQLDLRHNGGVVETSGAPGGGSGGDEGDGSGPLSGTFSAVMVGLFTEVSLRCSLFVPSPPTPPLNCCPQSPPFSRTAARVVRSFLGTPALSSMSSLPGIASTTDGSRVRGSGISYLVTASVCRWVFMVTWTSICTVKKTCV